MSAVLMLITPRLAGLSNEVEKRPPPTSSITAEFGLLYASARSARCFLKPSI